MAELANPEFVKALQNRDKSILTKIIDYVYNILCDKAKEALKKILPADKIKELRDSGTDLGMAKSILKDMLTEPIKNETNNTQFNKNKFGNSPLKDVYSDIQKNGLTKDNLQKIGQYAKDIIEGKAKYKRFNAKEQEGLARGGQIHAEATLIAGRSDNGNEALSGQKLEPTPGHPEKVRLSQRKLTNDELSERQEADVRKYAVKNKIWHPNTEKYLEEKYGQPFDSGKESKVFYDPERGVVIKSFDTFQQFPTLEKALDAITLHNTEFPETTLKVVGFGKNEDGNFSLITEQPYIEKHADGGKPTEAEINEFAAKRGYKPNPDRLGFDYTKDDTNLHDLHDGNVIKGKDGKLYAIDTTMGIKKGAERGENEINYEENKNTLEQRGIEGNKSGMRENGVQENLKGAKENNENAQYHKDELQSEEEKKLIN